MTIRMAVQLAFLAVMPAYNQNVMQGEAPGEPVRLLPMDSFVLDAEQDRRELPCTVRQTAPQLGFDLRFHGGFRAIVPFRQITNAARLTVIFRVTPESHPEAPIYFIQRWTVPPLQEDAPGEAEVHGSFILGPGKYHVDWLMRDREERFCSGRWQVSASTNGKDRETQVPIAWGAVMPEAAEPFANEVVAKHETQHALKVLVLLHVTPGTSETTDMRTEDKAALISIVRNIAREPRIAAYSMVAFNLERNEILYRGRSSPQVDFEALGNAMNRLKFGTIDVRSLREKGMGAQLLGSIVDEETKKNHPDAVIFVGQRTADDRFGTHAPSISPESPACPVFYLNYDANPYPISSRDPIGRIVKLWKGSVYTISKPRDLLTAWDDVMERASRSRSTSSLLPKN